MSSDPIQAQTLATRLRVGRRTVERILSGLRAEGEPITSERRGREVWYSLG